MNQKQALWRPGFHFTPPSGWMNDPNGLIYHKGWYHLFYQHYPYGCEWGSMHWGHAVSADLFSWRDLPVALTPDRPYDEHPRGGCFSGSAVEQGEGLALLYTGAVPDGPYPSSQNLAWSGDGVHFEKHGGNPVIAAPPPGYHPADFRDPKVIRREDAWYLVAGATTGVVGRDGDGAVLLYRSEDLMHWEFRSVLLRSLGRYGSMVECPDLFELDGKWVLLFSPMHRKDVRQCVYLVGEIDWETGEFHPQYEGVGDYGFDFYAPQTLVDEEGRRTAIGWMNAWPWMPWFSGHGPTAREGWRGAMSIPRVCRIAGDGGLCFAPTPHLEALRVERQILRDVAVGTEPLVLRPPLENQYELRITARCADIACRHLALRLFEKDGEAVELDISLQSNMMVLDRAHGGGGLSGKAFCPLELAGGLLDLQMIVDRSTLEIFVDGGRRVLSSNAYPGPGCCGLQVRTPFLKGRLESLELCGIRASMDLRDRAPLL